MNNFTNSSFEAVRSYSNFEITYHLLLLVLALLIIAVNLTVLYLFTKKRALRFGRTNRLLANLAMSDFLTGLLTIPLTVTSASLAGRPLKNLDVLFFVANVLSDFGTMYTVSSITLIMYDRYTLVCNPFSNVNRNLRIPSMGQVLTAWLCMLVIAALPLSWSYDLLFDPLEPLKDYQLTAERIYVLASIIVFFFLPSFFILFVLTLMFKEAKKFMVNDNKYDKKTGKASRAQTIVIFKFLFAFIAFSLCWVPLMTVRMLYYFLDDISMHLPQESLEIMFVMRCATSLINPLIYTWNDRDYKRAMSKYYVYEKLARIFYRRPKEQTEQQNVILS